MDPLILNSGRIRETNDSAFETQPNIYSRPEDINLQPIRTNKKRSRWPWGLVIAVLAVSFIAYLAVNGDLMSKFKKVESDSVAPSDGYQAVFLQNGNVFFGKLAFDDKWVVLSDVFYPQADQDLTGEDKTNLYIVKLGSELHGPEDTMYIKPEAVLYWEEIAQDSRVLDAINKYKTKK